MIAFDLQRALVEDVREILKDMYLKDPKGHYVPINVFSQFLPIQPPYRLPEADVPPEVVEEGLAASDVDTIPDPFPYVIVRLDQGMVESIDGEQAVTVDYIIGTYDDNLNNQGHQDVLNIIQKIYEHYSKRPMVKKKFMCDTEHMLWTLQDEESYPMYFGGMVLTFDVMQIEREDPYA